MALNNQQRLICHKTKQTKPCKPSIGWFIEDLDIWTPSLIQNIPTCLKSEMLSLLPGAWGTTQLNADEMRAIKKQSAQLCFIHNTAQSNELEPYSGFVGCHINIPSSKSKTAWVWCIHNVSYQQFGNLLHAAVFDG